MIRVSVICVHPDSTQATPLLMRYMYYMYRHNHALALPRAHAQRGKPIVVVDTKIAKFSSVCLESRCTAVSQLLH